MPKTEYLCPFCGAKLDINKTSGGTCFNHEDTFHAECGGCGLKTGEFGSEAKLVAYLTKAKG